MLAAGVGGGPGEGPADIVVASMKFKFVELSSGLELFNNDINVDVINCTSDPGLSDDVILKIYKNIF